MTTNYFNSHSFLAGMKLALLGPPGSGKGTVAERLVHEYNFAYIYAGGMLREEIKKGTVLGKNIKSFLGRGDLVPNQIVVDMVHDALKRKTHYILDGFPRSLEQIKLMKTDSFVDVALYLDVAEKEVIKRFAGRRMCEQGLHSYHVSILPPQKPGICDHDGSKLVRRIDDQPKVIRERFRVYRRETAPVVEYYKKKGILKRVDASGMPEGVYAMVKRVLNIKKNRKK